MAWERSPERKGPCAWHKIMSGTHFLRHCWPLESTHITWDNFYCLFQYFKFMIYLSNLSFLRYCFFFISSSCLRASSPPQLPMLNICVVGKPFLIVHMDTDLWQALCSIDCLPATYSPPHRDAFCNYSPSLRHDCSCPEFPYSTLTLKAMKRWLWLLLLCLCFFTMYLQSHF